MSQTILEVTKFPEFIKRTAKCILISSDDLNNSNFIINQYIRVLFKDSISSFNPIQDEDTKERNECKINQLFGLFLNQSYSNYSFIQMKWGNNLKNLKEQNLFQCLDLINDLDQFLDNSDQFDFDKFKKVLIKQLTDYFKANENTKVLIIDDITTFLSLNVDLKNIVNFVNFVKFYCLDNNISLIIQSFIGSDRLDPLIKLDTYLNSISHLVLLANKLETGYSNKVDGNLEIKNFVSNTKQTYLFKSTERQTKLFPPGTI